MCRHRADVAVSAASPGPVPSPPPGPGQLQFPPQAGLRHHIARPTVTPGGDVIEFLDFTVGYATGYADQREKTVQCWSMVKVMHCNVLLLGQAPIWCVPRPYRFSFFFLLVECENNNTAMQTP